MDQNINFNDRLDELPEYGETGTKHPTPEQLLLRMAVDKALMKDQLKIWEMYNYDRLTFVEIAKKTHTTKQAVEQRIKTIEKQLTKWVLEHKEVYEALKQASEDCECGLTDKLKAYRLSAGKDA